MAECLRQLGLKPVGGNFANMKRNLQRLDIKAEHWTGQGWNKGQQLKDWSDYSRAAVQLEEAERLVPGKSEALTNLGNCYFALGQTDAARESWTRAVAADPGQALANYTLGLLAEL